MNGAKYFYLGTLKYIKQFSGTNWISSWKLKECQKKILKL